MDNRRERKTSGESTASDSSETALCRPNYQPETPADLMNSHRSNEVHVTIII